MKTGIMLGNQKDITAVGLTAIVQAVKTVSGS